MHHMVKPTPPPPGKGVYSIRRENLNRLLAGEGRKTQLAVHLGVSRARISHILTGARRITTDQASELEQIIGLFPGELSIDPAQPRPPRGGATDEKLLLSSMRSVMFAASEMGVTLPPDIMSDLTTSVYQLSKPGKLLTQPTVQALVAQAAKRA